MVDPTEGWVSVSSPVREKESEVGEYMDGISSTEEILRLLKVIRETFYGTWIGSLTYLAPRLNSPIISLPGVQNITDGNKFCPRG